MKKMMVLAALVATMSGGCKKKRNEEGTGGPAPEPTPTGSGSGSAGSGSAATPAKPMTADELSKRFEQCWGFFNDAKWDDFKDCYTTDASDEIAGMGAPIAGNVAIAAGGKDMKAAFPDLKGEQVLEIISGHTVIAVTLMTGTNTGPMKTPMGEMPATKAKVGLMLAQVMELDDSGHAKKETGYFDIATMMGQMKPDPKMPARAVMDKAPMAKEVLVSKDDDKEKANIEVAKKVSEAFSKHDGKALGELLADDVVWAEMPNPKDWDKKETVKDAGEFWKAFSDAKIETKQAWAAGDYVAAVGSLEATNDGDMPEMHLKKTGKKVSVPHLIIFKIENGKVKRTWLFDQGMAFAMQLGLMPPPGAAPAPAAGSGSGSAGSAAPAGKK